MVPARAVLVVTLNILRVLCRKYGLCLALGLTLVLLQGYQGLRRAREEPQDAELAAALPGEDASVSARGVPGDRDPTSSVLTVN